MYATTVLIIIICPVCFYRNNALELRGRMLTYPYFHILEVVFLKDKRQILLGLISGLLLCFLGTSRIIIYSPMSLLVAYIFAITGLIGSIVCVVKLFKIART